jgi:hypothetical protein
MATVTESQKYTSENPIYTVEYTIITTNSSTSIAIDNSDKFEQKPDNKISIFDSQKYYEGYLYKYLYKKKKYNMIGSYVSNGELQKVLMSNYIYDIHFLQNRIPSYLHKIGILEKTWILGIKYFDFAGGDAQLTITGKVKFGETTRDAFNRELAEEFGGVISSTANIETNDITLKNGTCSTVIVSALDIIPYIPNKKYNKNKDNIKSRVQISIYGTLNDMKYMLETISTRNGFNNETGIEGVFLFPHSALYELA